jgi:exodeoxyribonuclease VII large subunit
MTQKIQQKLYNYTQSLRHLQEGYAQHSVEKKLQHKFEEIEHLKGRFTQQIAFKIQTMQREVESLHVSYPQAIASQLSLAQNQLNHLQNMLQSNHPKLKTKKGFAQLAKNHKVVALKSLHVGDIFEAQSESVVVEAQVLNKRNI